MIPIKTVRGVGPALAQLLEDAGMRSAEEVAAAPPEALLALRGLGARRVPAIHQAAKAMVQAKIADEAAHERAATFDPALAAPPAQAVDESAPAAPGLEAPAAMAETPPLKKKKKKTKDPAAKADASKKKKSKAKGADDKKKSGKSTKSSKKADDSGAKKDKKKKKSSKKKN
ncbi:helix-hairpin-helix domain-containing protein [Mesobacterium sp. TK19101]|uniref:Helix-hairpin-helix domain-containing protein n=1 Tax=Mesobacterium hydrothermale TaxID=3111907 RepID=A0ABU6HJU4_9RHOB|nr:helix-hairpin-helix domain-containing protein [Mesobacterium sp. TK19101]MEC3862120.1 helix-hairpin-helix domain-containing protein [Mesobacterium sp. TK19101]